MKSRIAKQILYAVLAASSVAACEKMNLSESADSENSGETSVTLRVRQFEQTPFPVTRAADITALCTRLSFLVYDSDGTRIRQVEQQTGAEDYGQTSIYLPKGHYFLVVLAHSGQGNPTSTNPRKIAFSNKTGFTDTFLYADSLIVSDSDISRDIALKRIVAMVRFVFDDKLPAKANRIRFYYEGGSGTFDAGADGWGVVKSKQSQYFDIAGNEQKFEIYTIPRLDSDHLEVMVTTFHATGDDDTGDIVTEKSIDSIPVRRNHITTCKGYLFAPVYGMTFTITIDDDWLGDLNFQIPK